MRMGNQVNLLKLHSIKVYTRLKRLRTMLP